ncbi:SMI1/KNR4 family protein [Klebsiella aerogenes]|uniref:SMI1/KNR4 family protein n=1 Tax=Klebsiella aerogenes TaxID=548 RepID=UPI0023B980CC|nr:SMI1/KNR4 family protein [Klebsiella aerogenes]ELA1890331.1 SMI1/KNR4 family protein [Klebsiella aerogenes]MDF0549653.1 SMI1/KNR4 family protein [Klebsiella aerogenes]
MQLTNAELAQVERIKNKIPLIAAQDPEYKVFGASKWKYQWPDPVNEQYVSKWEKQHRVALPREYRIFLRYIANGGPGFAYGLYPLRNTRIYGDIQRESPIPLYMTQAQVDTLNAQRESDDECLFYDGSLVIMTEGCTYDIALVVNGKYRGRLIQTDSDEETPFRFIHDINFLDWYERWLDDFIGGMSMGGFISSVAGSQKQLRVWFHSATIPQLRKAIVFSLCRFPHIDAETQALWESICRTDSDFILCEQALIRLIAAHAACVADIMRLYFNSPGSLQKIALNNLIFALQAGVDLDEYVEPLLLLIPQLEDNGLFEAVAIIRQTSHNRYATFLPLLNKVAKQHQRYILHAMRQSPDFKIYQKNYVELMLPVFASNEIARVSQAIQFLFEVEDDRIPPLINQTIERFPELTLLCENYYRHMGNHSRHQ